MRVKSVNLLYNKRVQIEYYSINKRIVKVCCRVELHPHIT